MNAASMVPISGTGHSTRPTTSESKPFSFLLDTLDEQDGNLKLKITAFNENGDRAELPLVVKVDNQVSKGAHFHIDRARSLLAERDFAGAQRAAKAAVKADPTSTDAKVILSSSSYLRGQMDIAEKYASDVESSQPNNLQNLQLLAAINAYKVFELRSQGDAETTRQTIYDAISANAKYRHKVLDLRMDAALGAASTPISKADLYIRGYRYSLAADAVRSTAEDSNFRDNDSVARYAYCLMKLGRYGDALEVLRKNAKFGKPSGYIGQLFAALREADSASLDHGSPVPGAGGEQSGGAFMDATVATYRAFHRNKSAQISQGLAKLEALRPNDIVTRYYKLKYQWAKGDFEAQNAVMRDTMMDDVLPAEILVENACQLANKSFLASESDDQKRFHMREAIAYFNAALEAKPDSVEALTGIALTYGLSGDRDAMLKFARAASLAGSRSGIALMTYAMALKDTASPDALRPSANQAAMKSLAESTKVLERAQLADPRLKGRAPNLAVVWDLFLKVARPPVVPAPSDSE